MFSTDYDALRAHTNWVADNALHRLAIPQALNAWMTDQGSLTTALINLSDGEFQVNVLSQQLQLPHWHEQKKLGRPLHRAAMLREVELRIFDQPVVFARSVIPLALVLKGRSGLANLGRKPLGHLLFKDGKIRVSKREFAAVTTNQPGAAEPITIHARRTPYDYLGSQILVSEFFLPTLSEYF